MPYMNPGVAALDALNQTLAARKAEKRQALLDKYAQEEAAHKMEMDRQGLDLDRQRTAAQIERDKAILAREAEESNFLNLQRKTAAGENLVKDMPLGFEADENTMAEARRLGIADKFTKPQVVEMSTTGPGGIETGLPVYQGDSEMPEPSGPETLSSSEPPPKFAPPQYKGNADQVQAMLLQRAMQSYAQDPANVERFPQAAEAARLAGMGADINFSPSMFESPTKPFYFVDRQTGVPTKTADLPKDAVTQMEAAPSPPVTVNSWSYDPTTGQWQQGPQMGRYDRMQRMGTGPASTRNGSAIPVGIQQEVIRYRDFANPTTSWFGQQDVDEAALAGLNQSISAGLAYIKDPFVKQAAVEIWQDILRPAENRMLKEDDPNYKWIDPEMSVFDIIAQLEPDPSDPQAEPLTQAEKAALMDAILFIRGR